MIVVSGCPRSGTSLMMQCLRAALGQNRILGHKFPPQARRERALAGADRAEARETIEYLQQRTGDSDRMRKAKEMNPRGFWEGRYAVGGVRWHPGIESTATPEAVCKVVSQGLARSNPAYIDRIIYMLRDPHEVATSQEDLRRGPLPRVAEVFQIHTPRMFVNVSHMAARWLDDYGRDIPLLMVDHRDLLTEPDAELARVREFLGEGDFSDNPVDPDLYRSGTEDVSHPLWTAAERIYDAMGRRAWDEVRTIYREHAPQLRREQQFILCPRRDTRSAYSECIKCRTIPRVMESYRQQAARDDTGWREEPCPFETGLGLEKDLPDRTYLSIQQSVLNNHWSGDRDDGWWAANQRLLRKPRLLRTLDGEPADTVRQKLSKQVETNGLQPKVAAEIETELLDASTTS